MQPDGKILVGGGFTIINFTPPPRLARLNNDGTLDDSFDANVANNNVFTIAVQPNGKILIGGTFTLVNGVICNRLARLNADGTLDGSFYCAANGSVFNIGLQPDSKICRSTATGRPHSDCRPVYHRGRHHAQPDCPALAEWHAGFHV